MRAVVVNQGGGLVGEFCAEERSLIILIKTGRGRAFTPLTLCLAGPALFVQKREGRSSILAAPPPDWKGSKGFT